MTDRQAKVTATIILIFITSILVGVGSNSYLGWGTLFAFWALGGIAELHDD